MCIDLLNLGARSWHVQLLWLHVDRWFVGIDLLRVTLPRCRGRSLLHLSSSGRIEIFFKVLRWEELPF